MAAFFQIYDNLHVGYNENEHANLLHDQLEDRIAGLNDEVLELYVMFYVTALVSVCVLYTIYIFLT